MTTPWDDFFKVYVELAQALLHELPQAHAEQLNGFISKCQAGQSQDEWHKYIVHEVISRFSNKSKEILLQEPTYFDNQLMLFPGIDCVDIAALWRSHPLYRNGIWAWIEQIYIIGNVCLHPNRKDKFLQIVRQIKASRPGSSLAAEPDEEPEDVQEVVKGIAEMMGIGNNPAMMEMMGEVAQHMHQTMTSSSNPMELIQAMLNGDTSALGGLETRMQQKMAQKIQSGEISEEELQRQRDGMLGNFGGMNGLLQMASGLGLNVGPMAEQVAASVPAAAAQAPTKQTKGASTRPPKK